MRAFTTSLFTALALILSMGGDLAYGAVPEVLSIRGNKHIGDFAEAKRVVRKVFEGHETTLYCGCRYYGKEVNLNSCGIPPGGKRRKTLEWEHMVPASKFGQAIAAWELGDDLCVAKNGRRGRGRKCAEKQSPLFRQMEGDLHNLWPESGEINGARSNKPPAEALNGSTKTWGTCATVVGKNEFVPREEAKGSLARAYLYMSWAYEVSMSPQEKELFENWDKTFPPTDFECDRNQRIAKVQGNSNPYVEAACKGDRVPAAKAASSAKSAR